MTSRHAPKTKDPCHRSLMVETFPGISSAQAPSAGDGEVIRDSKMVMIANDSFLH